jgi:hypothetical protein
MVAVAILAIALIGPFTAVTNALNASYVARDQLTASSLAQEGMEYIRSVRDNNYLNGRSWTDGLDPTSPGGGVSCFGAAPTNFCTIDPVQGDIHTAYPPAMTSYSAGNVPSLYQRPDKLFTQVQSGNTQTRFTRTVQITKIGNPSHEAQVTVVVSWSTGHQNYSVTLVDTLEDWL